MKRLLAVIIVGALLITQIAVGAVFAGSQQSDFRAVMQELEKLNTSQRASLAGALFDAAIAEFNDSENPTTEDTIFNRLKDTLTAENLWDSIVSKSGAVDGKISEASIYLMIGKLIANEDIVKELYSVYNTFLQSNGLDTKAMIKDVLKLPDSATDCDVYSKLLTLCGPMFTRDLTNPDEGNFERSGDTAAVLRSNQAIDQDLLDVFIEIFKAVKNISDFNEYFNSKVDLVVAKVNSYVNAGKVSAEDAIYGLVIFNLYQEPTPLDTTAPTAASTDPAKDATNVAINKVIKVTFSESIFPSTAFTNISLKNGASIVTTTNSASGDTLTITPAANLAYSTTYTVTVPASAVKDEAKNKLADDFTFSFTTRDAPDTTPPTINSTDPGNGAVNVAVGKVITVIFSENIAASDAYANVTLKKGSDTAAITKEISGNILRITPNANLANGAQYTVTVPAGAVKDAAGNKLAAARTFSFTTTSAPDTVAPAVSSTDPANNAVNVAVNKVITVNFSEKIDRGSDFANITLKSGSTTIAGANAVDSNKLTITPNAGLSNSTKYTVTVPAKAVKDTAGNELEAAYTFSFTTVSGSSGSTYNAPSLDPAVQNAIDDIKNLLQNSTFNQGSLDSALGSLDKAAAAIEKISDPTEAFHEALALIEKLADLAAKIENAGLSANKLEDTLLALEQKVMSKVNSFSVAESMTQAKADEIAGKLDTIMKTAGDLNAAFAKIKVGVRAEASLDIKFTGTAAGADVKFDVPASLITAAAQKKLDSFKIETPTATLSFAPGFIPVDGAKTVTFTAKEVDAANVPSGAKTFAAGGQTYDLGIAVDGKAVGNLSKAVTVTVPYTLGANENPDTVTVFYMDETGKTQNISGTYDAATKTVSFKTTHFSLYLVKANPVNFTDLDKAAWAKKYIEAVTAKGAIVGVGNNKFDPDAYVTRAQFTAMVVSTLKLTDSSASGSFKDVSKGAWYYTAISAALKNGLISSKVGDSFHPNDYITRQDMAVILANALKLMNKAAPESPDTYVNMFADHAKIAADAQASVAIAVKYAIMGGTPDKLFNPLGKTKRCEAAVVIYNLMNLK